MLSFLNKLRLNYFMRYPESELFEIIKSDIILHLYWTHFRSSSAVAVIRHLRLE